MIVIAGVASEPPIRLALRSAKEQAIEAILLDERSAGSWLVDLEVDEGGVSGQVWTPENCVDLSEVTGVYLRLLGDAYGAGAHHAVPDPAEPGRSMAAVALLSHWAQNATARVANRPEAMCSNASKPFQASLIARAGFAVPDILVTNDPEAVHEFAAKHQRVVFKSTSGVRSIVRELTGERLAALDRVRYLPTQFQALVAGDNVRVHVVDTEVFACRVSSTTIDYRYPDSGHPPASLGTVELPANIAEQCVLLSRTLELPLAGIDLLHDDEDQWWCLEVNPSPAYSCFQEPTGLPIAQSLVRWLNG